MKDYNQIVVNLITHYYNDWIEYINSGIKIVKHLYLSRLITPIIHSHLIDNIVNKIDFVCKSL